MVEISTSEYSYSRIMLKTNVKPVAPESLVWYGEMKI